MFHLHRAPKIIGPALRERPRLASSARTIRMSLIVEAMVQTLTEQVFTALMNQAEFALDFSSQFAQLKTGLDLTKALLADTESLRHKNNIVKRALFELREVIYEADDVLTDCLVRDEYRKDGSCSGSLLHDPFFLQRTGKKLRDINLHMKQIEKTLGRFFRAPDSIHQEDAYQVRVIMSQDWNPTEIIGLDSDVEKIKGWIFDTSKVLHHVGIVGMGGLGKTTIAQKIFHDLVVSHFHKLIWVCVSQSFSAERIMRSILEGLGENVFGSGVTQILSRIQQVFKDKICLIVMDDVWSHTDVDWWTNLCSVIPKQGSCIIVTTRHEDAAIGMGVENSRIHRPKTLDDEESWCLFSKFAFPTSKGLCPEDKLENLGKELLKKCGGLPLAIKAIGSLLASKVDSPSQWRRVLESFHALTTEGKTSSVMASLRLSYDELPPSLKQCLLCFSIYPEDYKIRADQLIHWWIAEGLIQSKGSRTAVEVGYEYLAELISRCLVEIVHRRGFDGRVYKCKIHDMVRELIIMIAEEEFCKFDERGRQELTTKTRWLCFIDEMDDKSLKNSSKLRALLLMSSRRFHFERKSRFLRSLRMLDLSNCTVDEHCVKDLFSWISSLKRLASLNLSGIQALKEVPFSFHKLLNLQLLLLTGCSNLEKIHPSITNLKKLIILDLRGCPIQYMPQGLGRLSYLQELSGYKVVSQPRKPCFRLFEIRELINLRVLRIHVSGTTVIADNELDVLSQLRRLNVLAIDAEDCRNNNVLEMLENLTPPPSLQELYLRNYKKETLPNWVNPGQLSRLQYLCIENGDLVNLSGGQTTWNLEGLCLKYLMRLEVNWKELEKDMPVLHYMEISHCYNLKDFPCSVMEPGVRRKN